MNASSVFNALPCSKAFGGIKSLSKKLSGTCLYEGNVLLEYPPHHYFQPKNTSVQHLPDQKKKMRPVAVHCVFSLNFKTIVQGTPAPICKQVVIHLHNIKMSSIPP